MAAITAMWCTFIYYLDKTCLLVDISMVWRKFMMISGWDWLGRSLKVSVNLTSQSHPLKLCVFESILAYVFDSYTLCLYFLVCFEYRSMLFSIFLLQIKFTILWFFGVNMQRTAQLTRHIRHGMLACKYLPHFLNKNWFYI